MSAYESQEYQHLLVRMKTQDAELTNLDAAINATNIELGNVESARKQAELNLATAKSQLSEVANSANALVLDANSLNIEREKTRTLSSDLAIYKRALAELEKAESNGFNRYLERLTKLLGNVVKMQSRVSLEFDRLERT